MGVPTSEVGTLSPQPGRKPRKFISICGGTGDKKKIFKKTAGYTRNKRNTIGITKISFTYTSINTDGNNRKANQVVTIA